MPYISLQLHAEADGQAQRWWTKTMNEKSHQKKGRRGKAARPPAGRTRPIFRSLRGRDGEGSESDPRGLNYEQPARLANQRWQKGSPECPS